jgi:hypothetical protein
MRWIKDLSEGEQAQWATWTSSSLNFIPPKLIFIAPVSATESSTCVQPGKGDILRENPEDH